MFDINRCKKLYAFHQPRPGRRSKEINPEPLRALRKPRKAGRPRIACLRRLERQP
jgi:hypothetical protein